MKKSPILLFAFLIAAVGAAGPKDSPRLAYGTPEAGVGHRSGASADATLVAGYPPCSRTVTDRCIQLYERRVRAALPRAAARPAMGGPIEGIADYPHCSRLITDECVQLFDRERRPARAAPARRPRASNSEASTPGI